MDYEYGLLWNYYVAAIRIRLGLAPAALAAVAGTLRRGALVTTLLPSAYYFLSRFKNEIFENFTVHPFKPFVAEATI